MESTNNDNNFEQDAFGTPDVSETTQTSNAAAFSAPDMNGPKVSKVEYCNTYADAAIKKEITTGCVIAYICAGITLLAAFVSGLGAIVDVIIMVGLALGIHLKKSLVCSIILTVYGCFNVIMAIILTGKLGGWLILVGAIVALIACFRLDKEYKAYLAK